MSPRKPPDAAEVLATSVFVDGGYKPFAELTREDVGARAEELKAAAGFGPTARVAQVGMAWSELGRLMDTSGAPTVGDLPSDEVAARAARLWVVASLGSAGVEPA